jgi:hypothetical protein
VGLFSLSHQPPRESHGTRRFEPPGLARWARRRSDPDLRPRPGAKTGVLASGQFERGGTGSNPETCHGTPRVNGTRPAQLGRRPAGIARQLPPGSPPSPPTGPAGRPARAGPLGPAVLLRGRQARSGALGRTAMDQSSDSSHQTANLGCQPRLAARGWIVYHRHQETWWPEDS